MFSLATVKIKFVTQRRKIVLFYFSVLDEKFHGCVSSCILLEQMNSGILCYGMHVSYNCGMFTRSLRLERLSFFSNAILLVQNCIVVMRRFIGIN